MATTAKLVEVMFDKAVDTYEHQMSMLDLVDTFEDDGGTLQKSGNYVWRPVQQHAPILDGFDMTGLETDIIEEEYPALLGTPKNDFIQQRVDDLRTTEFWERRGEQSGLKQATELNRAIAALIANTGSLFFQTNVTSGYDAIAEAQAMMNERQLPGEASRFVVLNDRDNLKYGKDLAARETINARPEEVWATGLINKNVAGFETVMTGSFLPNLAGGAASTTTTAAVSEAPEGGTVNATTGDVSNVDYRKATITVTASAAFAVGDRVTFVTSGAAPVNALGRADKVDSGQQMTFTIVAIPDATHVTVYPKPIALDDAALSTLEKAYANINTQIDSGATMTRVNTTASAKMNIFGAKNSIEVFKGDAPLQLLSELGGMKVISTTLKNGLKMYMAYDGNLATLNFRCRLFTWYGITNKDPSSNGGFTTY